jgi:hypothetical protein
MLEYHQTPIAMNGNNHVQNGCTELTKEDNAIRCRTPGNRIGLFASNAPTELYTNPSPDRRIVRRQSFVSGGFEIDAENPVQRRNVGNMV